MILVNFDYNGTTATIPEINNNNNNSSSSSDLPLKEVAILVSSMAIASQVVVLLMAKGLPGNFSAQTMMAVQAVGEIANQVFILQMMSCHLWGKFVTRLNNLFLIKKLEIAEKWFYVQFDFQWILAKKTEQTN